jgi:hypothetical protein
MFPFLLVRVAAQLSDEGIAPVCGTFLYVIYEILHHLATCFPQIRHSTKVGCVALYRL